MSKRNSDDFEFADGNDAWLSELYDDNNSPVTHELDNTILAAARQNLDNRGTPVDSQTGSITEDKAPDPESVSDRGASWFDSTFKTTSKWTGFATAASLFLAVSVFFLSDIGTQSEFVEVVPDAGMVNTSDVWAVEPLAQERQQRLHQESLKPLKEAQQKESVAVEKPRSRVAEFDRAENSPMASIASRSSESPASETPQTIVVREPEVSNAMATRITQGGLKRQEVAETPLSQRSINEQEMGPREFKKTFDVEAPEVQSIEVRSIEVQGANLKAAKAVSLTLNLNHLTLYLPTSFSARDTAVQDEGYVIVDTLGETQFHIQQLSMNESAFSGEDGTPDFVQKNVGEWQVSQGYAELAPVPDVIDWQNFRIFSYAVLPKSGINLREPRTLLYILPNIADAQTQFPARSYLLDYLTHDKAHQQIIENMRFNGIEESLYPVLYRTDSEE